MVAKRNGLRHLQMRKARHDAFGMFFGAGNKRRLKGAQASIDFLCRVTNPQPEIGRDLIVA